jgi:hypothetical protein
MKKLFAFLFIPILAPSAFTQNKAASQPATTVPGAEVAWQPAMLNTMDGTNSFDGVEAYYALTTCTGTEMVLVKIVNHNTYTIKAEWRDLILTQADKQLFRSNQKNFVVLAPKSLASGSCSGNAVQLTLRLSDFGTDAKNFKIFGTSEFDFNAVH